ncbi:MAG: hypothetical protein JWN44_5002 [Myxococcales bacterium]|nr:hypothetical protein [Myxococcales bacterium]
MPTRSELRALATELRHAHTRHFAMEIVERIQHTIVRIEELLVSPNIDQAQAEAVYTTARELLDYCNQFTAKG